MFLDAEIHEISKVNDIKSPKKRSLNVQPLNLYVEYLAVIDSSVVAKYQNLFSQLSYDLVLQYLNIYLSQILNSVTIILID